MTARHVVLAAGAWGTQSLLHDLRRRRRLPRLSDRVGHLTRTNSEALLGALVPRVPADGDLSRGVAITSSFHPDADTHVENCRYGKGSNAMGLLAHPARRRRPGRAAVAEVPALRRAPPRRAAASRPRCAAGASAPSSAW